MHARMAPTTGMKIVYVEVVKPERLVYDHVSGPKFHVTVNFTEEGNKTRSTCRCFLSRQRSATIRSRNSARLRVEPKPCKLQDHLAKWQRQIMNIALWIIQVLLALLFLFAGGVKLIMPIEEMTKGMPVGDSGSSCVSLECVKFWAGSV